MTWFVEDKRTWSQKLLGNILKCGQLPKHVAIIMDGNRRYARVKHLEKIEGHRSGFEKLVEVTRGHFSLKLYFFIIFCFLLKGSQLVFCHGHQRSDRVCF